MVVGGGGGGHPPISHRRRQDEVCVRRPSADTHATGAHPAPGAKTAATKQANVAGDDTAATTESTCGVIEQNRGDPVCLPDNLGKMRVMRIRHLAIIRLYSKRIEFFLYD